MSRAGRIWVTIVVFLCLVCFPAISLLYQMAGEGARSKRLVPAFEMIDVHAVPVDTHLLRGNIYTAAFTFSRGGILAGKLLNAQKALSEAYADHDFIQLTFTIDPEHDDPLTWQRFAQRFEPDSAAWRFISESREATYELIQGGFFGRVKFGYNDPTRFESDPKIAVVNRKGFIRGYYPVSTEEDVERLIREVGELLKADPYDEE